jgi:hypothetical protein
VIAQEVTADTVLRTGVQQGSADGAKSAAIFVVMRSDPLGERDKPAPPRY